MISNKDCKSMIIMLDPIFFRLLRHVNKELGANCIINVTEVTETIGKSVSVHPIATTYGIDINYGDTHISLHISVVTCKILLS